MGIIGPGRLLPGSRVRKFLIVAVLICLSSPSFAELPYPDVYFPRVGITDCKSGLEQRVKYVCRHADLLAQDKERARLYQDLHKSIPYDDRRVFLTQEWSWENAETACFDSREEARYHKDYMRCVQDRLQERVAALKALKADPSLLMKKAADYPYMDPWYFNKFGRRFAGKAINLNGFIEIVDCEGPLKPVRAHIRHNESTADVEFESLTINQRDFYCEKGIGTQWDGVVRLDGQGYAIFHMK